MNAPKANILLVDDHPENLIALEAILDRLGQNLVKATSGQEALRCLLHQDFAAILLDVQMPGMDGFETATLIRQRERSRNTPIIFLTAFSTSDPFVFKGYEIGAVDYLLKPLDAGVLTSKVSVFVELFKKTMEVQRQAAELVAINGKLKQSEERFRSLSACAPLGIFSLDTSGRCTYTNLNCEAICGFTIGESWETAWAKCIHAEDRDRVFANWSSCTQNDQTYIDEFRIYAPDGGLRWVQVATSTMLSPQRQSLGHVGTIEDITERKLAEVVREQMIREQAARAEAEAANRMKDEFLAIVSHELRTPLNSILGWSQLLLTRKFDQSSTLRALETIARNARSQAQLIEDLLDISKIIRGKLRLCMQPVNAIELIKIVLETVRPQAEAKAIELETLLDENAQMVCGDPERLQQIIWNLLSNAIKFTPNEGKVEIRLSVEGSMPEVRGERLDSTLVSESLLLTNSSSSSLDPQASDPGFACIQVIDNGIGIAADFLPYVFDRFRQADSSSTRSYGGLGLGLTIVSHLVQLHSGKIEACSEGEGKGATFTVKIPLLERAGKDRKDKQEEELGDGLSLSPNPLSPSPSTHNELHTNELTLPSNPPPKAFLDGVQVLVVEDNNDTRDLVKMILQQSGAQVTDVASVAEAMEFLERSSCHLMVSDIGMPEEDGYQLIRKVRDFEQQQGRKIPAIALTAYTRAEERIKALTAGFQLHVSKPVEPTKLLTAVAQLVASLKIEQVRTQ